jgi:hypothetical protein
VARGSAEVAPVGGDWQAAHRPIPVLHLEHRAKKWEPVFRKNDATTNIWSRRSASDLRSLLQLPAAATMAWIPIWRAVARFDELTGLSRYDLKTTSHEQ